MRGGARAAWGIGVALASAGAARAGQPAPWWAAKGIPGLREFHHQALSRRDTPYLEQTFFLDAAAYRTRAADAREGLELLRKGQVALGVRNRFLLGVGARSRGEILTAQLKRCWPGGGDPGANPTARAFLAFSARLVNARDVVEYLYPADGGLLWVQYGTEAPRAFRDRALVEAMLTLEFGRDPENPEGQARILAALRRLP